MTMTTASRRLTLRAHFGANIHADALGTLYFALFSGDPAGSGTEPTTTGGYARVAVTNDGALFGTIGAGQLSAYTQAAIVWPAATGLYSITGELDYWAIFDASSGGSLWYSGPLNSTITITGVGDQPRIPAAALYVSV